MIVIIIICIMYFCNKDGDEKLYYVFYYFGILEF